MAQKVVILVADDGKDTIGFSGFGGNQCHKEREKILLRLQALGIDVEVKDMTPIDEENSDPKIIDHQKSKING